MKAATRPEHTSTVNPLLRYDLNTVSAKSWRNAEPWMRTDFGVYWAARGIVSFVCINCGFPTAYGCSSCEACR